MTAPLRILSLLPGGAEFACSLSPSDASGRRLPRIACAAAGRRLSARAPEPASLLAFSFPAPCPRIRVGLDRMAEGTQLLGEFVAQIALLHQAPAK